MIETVRIAWATVAHGMPRRDVAWGLLRELVPDARPDNPCPRCGGPHGPVRLPRTGRVASVAYAGAYAVVVVAEATRVASIGVDAEPEADARRDGASLAGILGPGRAATVRDWTRVEAVAKADGRGLRIDPARIVVTEHGAGWSAAVPGGGRFIGWDAAGPAGLVVSVAVRP